MYDNPDARAFFFSSYQQDAPRRRMEVHGAKATIGAICTDGFIEMPDKHDGAASLIGSNGEMFEHISYLVGAVHVHAAPKVTLERVENQQFGIGGFNRLPDSLVQQGERTLCLVNADNAV